MDNKVNYTLVGLFVVVLSLALIGLCVWLSSQTFHKSYKNYLVYAIDSVSGLTLKSPVEFNGVPVGYVDDIELSNKNAQLVELTLKIDRTIPITTSTRATLTPQGVTGLVYVGLLAGTARAPRLKRKKGDLYPIIPYQKPLLAKLTDVLPEIADNIKQVTQGFSQLFNKENKLALQRSLKELEATLKTTNHLTHQLEATSKDFSKTMQHTNDITNNFNYQIMPTLDQLLIRTNRAALGLEQLTSDLKDNPSMLLRGKQPAPEGPGEK